MARQRNPLSFPTFRLSRAQSVLLGLSAGAKRAVSAADLETVRAIEAGQIEARDVANFVSRIETYSERQFRQWQNFVEFGEPVSKEKRTKKLRSGSAQYRTKGARKSAVRKPRYDAIKRQIPGISDADKKLIDEKRRSNFKKWSDAKKRRFKALFDKYPRRQLLAVLDSPPVSTRRAF